VIFIGLFHNEILACFLFLTLNTEVYVEVLVVSTGRYGTRSVTALLNNILEVNFLGESSKSAKHESLAGYFYEGVNEYFSIQRTWYLKRILNKMTHWAEVGNGYQFVLPIIYEVFGSNLKVINLVRRKEDFIFSALKHIKTNPQVWGGYINEEIEYQLIRPTAVDFGDCTIEEWTSFTLEKKLDWHWEKSQSEFDEHQQLFKNTMTIHLEDLNSEHKLIELCQYLDVTNSNNLTMPHLNSFKPFYPYFSLLAENDLQRGCKRFSMFDFKRAFLEDGYALEYFLEKELSLEKLGSQSALKRIKDIKKLLSKID